MPKANLPLRSRKNNTNAGLARPANWRCHREGAAACLSVVIVRCWLTDSPRINDRQRRAAMAVPLRIQCACRNPDSLGTRTEFWRMGKVEGREAVGSRRKCDRGCVLEGGGVYRMCWVAGTARVTSRSRMRNRCWLCG